MTYEKYLTVTLSVGTLNLTKRNSAQLPEE